MVTQNNGSQVSPQKRPNRNRFNKSGNPKGRPKGSKNRRSIVKAIANEMHYIKGEHRSTLELVLLALRNKALTEKNVRAFEELHRLLKTYQPEPDREGGGYIIAPAEMTPEEWVENQERLNKTRKPPPGIEDIQYE